LLSQWQFTELTAIKISPKFEDFFKVRWFCRGIFFRSCSKQKVKLKGNDSLAIGLPSTIRNPVQVG
jgi:hypothetical protein